MKRKMSKKIILLVSIMVVSMTAMTTSAYFNSAVNLDSLFGNDSASKLNITNGNVSINFEDTPSTWKVTQNTQVTNTNSITNPSEGDTAEFGPVILKSTSNLTTNVDLLADYELTTSVDGEEVKNITTKIPSEPFEVIVGDMDNFGYGFSGISNYDVYSGTRYNRTDYCAGQGEKLDNGLNVYPTNYDATGTDRRMCPSGFYKLMENVIGANNMNNHTKTGNNATDALLGANFGLYQYIGDSKNFVQEGGTIGGNSGGYTVGILKNDTTIGSTKIYGGYRVYWDGYTNRAIRGVRGIGGKDPNQVYVDVSDKIFDGKNWAFLNSPQPITFKYAPIDDEKDITSAVIQMYVDDFQSGDADKSILGSEQANHFSNDSTSRFTAILGGVEIPELSNLINSLCQSGPAGQLISFNIPQKYLYLIKKYAGTGANEGLQLLIDDARIGTSGDSYCIDFAKLTVNSKTSSVIKMNVSGKVVDSDNKPIEGITIEAGDGTTVTTDANGQYSLNITPGTISLVFSKNGYTSQTYISSDIYNSDGTVKSNISIPDITMQAGGSGGASDLEGEKFGIEIIVEKIDNKGNAIETKTYSSEKPIIYSGTQGQNADCTLALQPNFEYKVTYKLKLKNLRNYDNNITLNVKGNLIAKATQENNPVWNEDGTGENYKDAFNEGDSTGEISGNVAEVKIVAKDKSGNILDNVYAIWNENKILCNNASEYDFKVYTGTNTIKIVRSGYEDVVVSRDISNGKNTIEVTMENVKPNINFEIPDNGYWGGDSATIKVGDTSYNADKTPFTGWKGIVLEKAQLAKLDKSTITVTNGANTSGALYYFSTQRVYICTNGSTEDTVAADGSIIVECIDETGNIISKDTYKGAVGNSTTIQAKQIEGYEVDGNSSVTATYSEAGTKVTFKYKKLNCVTVEYRDISNNNLIGSEKYYGKSTDSYSITGKEQVENNGSYYDINQNETFTGKYDSNKTITYYYNKCNVTINYIDENRTPIAGTEYKYIKNNEIYTFVAKDISNYVFKEVQKDGIVQSENEVTINGDVTISYVYKLKGVVVHYYNSDWTTVKMHSFNTGDANTTTWPGSDMTSKGNGWYEITLEGSKQANVIFNNGAGTQEPTGTNTQGYVVSGEVWIKNGLVFNYNPDNFNKVIVHYYNSNWSSVKMHSFNTGDANTTTWPGNDMTNTGNGWYEITLEGSKQANVIFNNGAGTQEPTGTNTSGYSVLGEVWIKDGNIYTSKP